MRSLILSLCLMLFFTSPAAAFLYEVEILTVEQIQKLSDEELLRVYTDAAIERAASETFHGRAGFSPKEYGTFKSLLGMVVRLRQEMLKREMTVPPINEWLQ